jgi:hypothetical protein
MRENAMRGWGRRTFLWSLCGSALVAGCNFPTAMYFLMPEAKEPAGCKRLASEDSKKEVKVVLWPYMSLDPREEFIQADRRLALQLAEEIRKLSVENHEKVTVVKPSLVEQYKSRQLNWQSLDPQEVGQYFHADYVVNLEIDKLSLYEPTAREMYKGYAHILVSVVDVNNPEDLHQKEFTDRYPSELRGGWDTFDMEPSVFREKFLGHVARKLAFYFVEHPKRERMIDSDD